MVKKLKLPFLTREWKLGLKLLLFIGGLFIVSFFDFSWLALLIFFSLSFFLYFSLLKERSRFKFSFLILTVTSLLYLRFFEVNPFAFFIFGILFCLFLGLANFVFKNPKNVYLFLNTILLLIIFLLYYAKDFSSGISYFLINLLTFLTIFFLFKECFSYLLNFHPQYLFASLVLSFINQELLWSIKLLPFGFINLALFHCLFIFSIRDLTVAFFEGKLNRALIFSYSVIFLALTSLILLFSKWTV